MDLDLFFRPHLKGSDGRAVASRFDANGEAPLGDPLDMETAFRVVMSSTGILEELEKAEIGPVRIRLERQHRDPEAG